MEKKNLFLSYCWNDSNEANKIYDYFKSSQNIELHRDTIDIGKWGSIKEYMQSISDMDYTILLISDSYLKSANCMYEVLEVMRDRNYRDKIFPAVICSEIYNPITRAKYVKHWQDEFSELESRLKEIKVQNLGKLNEDLKRRQDISSNIAEFLNVVSDMNNPNIEDVCVRIEEKLNQKGFYGSSQEDGKVERRGKSYIENRAEEYAQKWDKNVFLNDFNERDENAGVNIKLRDIYLEDHLPHYIWKTNKTPLFDLKKLLSEHIVDNNDRKMLLILGQPGIGKSTLITWIMANLVEKKDDIYVYQFASDLKNINWQEGNILSEILKTLKLNYDELENKTLILDGFDEVYVKSDRERILNKLNEDLKRTNYLKKFSLIITCRENYVSQVQLEECDYITLQVWDEEQIKSFYEIYEKKSVGENIEGKASEISESKINKILEKKGIFGIPLILYMVLALDITIEQNSSIIDIYDQVFSLERGGIYDRCYDLKHRINSPEIKEHIHQISQRIAFWIFENNADRAFISQKKFEEICENEMRRSGKKGEEIEKDVLIGNFFKLKHYEGKETDELQFVHRSIYEYFVVTYFFESIHELKSKEEIAGKLGELLKDGCLSEQILEFIKYKFDSLKEYNLSDITREVFIIMLRDGMTYHVKGKYKNIIVREMSIFSNMLEVVHLWNPKLGGIDKSIILYLNHNHSRKLNLRGIDLKGVGLGRVDLGEADLREADLSRAYLHRVDFKNADLSGADLREADLSGADLMGANISGADLRKASLCGVDLRTVVFDTVDLSEADLSRADLRGVDLSGANLSRANLSGANLRKADISGADLMGADISGADLRGANISGADISGADIGEIDDFKKILARDEVEEIFFRYS